MDGERNTIVSVVQAILAIAASASEGSSMFESTPDGDFDADADADAASPLRYRTSHFRGVKLRHSDERYLFERPTLSCLLVHLYRNSWFRLQFGGIFKLCSSAAFLPLSLSLCLTLLETASSPGQLLCRPPMLLPSRAQLRVKTAKPRYLRRIPFGGGDGNGNGSGNLRYSSLINQSISQVGRLNR